MLIALLRARLGDVWVAADAVRKFSTYPLSETDTLWFPGPIRFISPSGGPRFTDQQLQLAITTLKVTEQATSIEIAGPLGHLLAFQTIQLLRIVGGCDRIGRCDCGRLFLRIGKRRFCSETCQQRVFMRRYRA